MTKLNTSDIYNNRLRYKWYNFRIYHQRTNQLQFGKLHIKYNITVGYGARATFGFIDFWRWVLVFGASLSLPIPFSFSFVVLLLLKNLKQFILALSHFVYDPFSDIQSKRITISTILSVRINFDKWITNVNHIHTNWFRLNLGWIMSIRLIHNTAVNYQTNFN